MCHRKMCTHIQTCLGFTMLRVELLRRSCDGGIFGEGDLEEKVKEEQKETLAYILFMQQHQQNPKKVYLGTPRTFFSVKTICFFFLHLHFPPKGDMAPAALQNLLSKFKAQIPINMFQRTRCSSATKFWFHACQLLLQNSFLFDSFSKNSLSIICQIHQYLEEGEALF